MTEADLQNCNILFQRDDRETYIKTFLTTVVTN